MNYYSTISGQLKRSILNFSSKICEGLSRPSLKFISCILYGLLKGQSVMLSDIARSLEENTSSKKVIDRLSRNLTKFEKSDELTENYISEMKKSIDEETIYCLDPGDISKEYSRKQEGIGKIWDASRKRSVNGYKTVEVTALTHKTKLPIPVYTKVYSSKEEDAEKLTEENLKALKHLDKHLGNGGIRVMDRGMDDIKIYKHCKDQKFIVRAKKTAMSFTMAKCGISKNWRIRSRVKSILNTPINMGKPTRSKYGIFKWNCLNCRGKRSLCLSYTATIKKTLNHAYC